MSLEALAVRDDVGFFQAVRAVLAKNTVSDRRASGEMDHAIRQLVSKAVVSDEVIDLFAKDGIRRQDISILSEDFLGELRDMPQKNLAAEMLRKLLDDEVKATSRRNVVNARKFSDLLDAAIRRYRNRALSTREVIDELIGLARQMQEARARGDVLRMSEDEVAFYDALHIDETAEQVLGDDNLRMIARELVDLVRRNVTIDWQHKESVRAKLRVIVKRILRKHGYPPGKQDEATRTVLEQAELFSEHWMASN